MTSATAVPATDQPALRVEKLTKHFNGTDKPVWSNVSFNIPSAQSVAIIGGNGTGKSTLLRCCLRLIEPNGGDIHLHGEKLTGAGSSHLRRMRSSVGFVFQKHNLVPRLSVLTNVVHGGMARVRGPRYWHHALADRTERQFAMHCLEQVGLAQLAERRADHLSGGQSQRVAIARALMQRPRMIFADEPVASLDPQAGQEVMETFAKLGREHGLTLIFVSHHLEHALNYADRILGLRGGCLELDTPSASQDIQSLRAMYE